ncbi:WASH complex subunit 2 isoform X2 [Agrilus planipennis]|uniref:WASH complex subunit 2 isoform X2 n=1 Tax=Agrilus planipennis TaxID=224129 RepID=A0A1W4WNN7_AGRPL|nr:WASH complex subunit 2 isoform X2 [Agrilus planipennis]
MSECTFSSTEDIIKCADSWNLAKDVGLLHHLEKFSEELIGNASKTKEKLSSLLDELNNTHVKFNVIQNRFQSLHNTQFIESRVYEDDETLQPQEGVKKDDSQNLTENDKLKTMKNVILKGVEVIDKYFDKVEVPGSDSEDEIDFPRFSLRAKDPYSDRPLPYVIGTEEWHKYWHVGLLEETSSESECEMVSNKESCSDSEDTLPVYRPQVLGTSETSSEIEFNKSHIPLPTTTSDEIKKGSDVMTEDSDKNSFSSQTPIANSTFADQLAAKLGDIFDHNRNIEEPVVNTRPIQKVAAPYKYKNMFPEEPPPLDNGDDDDIFNSAKVKTNDLFDDLDDSNSLWSNNPVKIKPSDNKINENNNVEIQNKMVNENRKENINNNKKALDLFDDDDEDSDDIFNTNPVVNNKKPLLIGQKNITVPFFSGEPPNINAKKPVIGSSSSTKNDNLINNEKDTSPSNISTSESDPTKKDNNNLKETIDIFNDNANDLFDDDLFSNIETKKFTSNLFSTISDDASSIENSKSDLKENISSNSLINSSNSASPSLTNSNDAHFPPSIIESKREVAFEKSTTSKPSALSLFDDVNDDFDDLFSQDELKSNNIDGKISESTDQTSQNDKIIFNDIWPGEIKNDSEQLFSNEPFVDNISSHVDENITSNMEKEPDNNEFDEEQNSNIKDIPPSKNSLFSNSPPELDDDWDVTSDNNLFEDMFEKMPEIQPYKLGLFMSDEPPSLFPTLDNHHDENEQGKIADVDDTLFSEAAVKREIRENTPKTSNLKSSEEETVESVSSLSGTNPQKLPGKLKHSLNINVNALLPSGAQKKKSETLINVIESTAANTPKLIESEQKLKQEEGREEQEHASPQRSSISFDDEVDANIKTLDSVTKNRVRAPVQRRPSTRKGRQQYLLNTDSNYTISLPEGNDTKTSSDSLQRKTESVTTRPKKGTLEEISTSKTERLFGSSESESDSELFSTSKLKINEKQKTESALDDGSDFFKIKNETEFTTDSDDIFKVSDSISIKSRTEKKAESRKDLFGEDSDDDDDLFATWKPKRNDGADKSTEKNQSGAKARVANRISKNSIKKLDNEARPVLDDPLNLLGGN